MRARVARALGAPAHAVLVGLSAFALMAAWSIGAPPYSGPDESDHVERAVSVVRGQIIPVPFEVAGPASTLVDIPQVFTIGDKLENCYRFAADIPASCSPHLAVSTGKIQWTTDTGRYPPLYYAIVGLPSLAVVSQTALYLMRLLSALLGSALIGLAAYVIARWSSRRLLPLGVLAGATPMAIYLNAVVNPNGLEISAAIALWVSSLVLFDEYGSSAPRGLVAVVGVSAAVLASARQLSPLWAVLILVSTLAFGSSRRAVAGLARRADVRLTAALALLVGIAAVFWTFRYHALALIPAGIQIKPGSSELHIVWLALQNARGWFPQMVGIFGWLDAAAPGWAIDLWYVGAGSLIVLGVVLAGKRRGPVLLGMVVLGFVVSLTIDVVDARKAGLLWEGRHLLPYAAGLPIVAAAALERSATVQAHVRAVCVAVALVLCCAEIASYFQALRRYTVGQSGPLTLAGGWSPPAGPWPMVALAVIASIAFAASLLSLGWPVRQTAANGRP